LFCYCSWSFIFFRAVERGENKVQLQGRHDVDQGWIKYVRSVGENATAPLIVPRFMLHNWAIEDYQSLFDDQSLLAQLIALLVRECVYVGFGYCFPVEQLR